MSTSEFSRMLAFSIGLAVFYSSFANSTFGIAATGRGTSRVASYQTQGQKSDPTVDTVEQHISSIRPDPITLPVLIGTDASPVHRLRVDVTGATKPISIESLTVHFEAPTDLADIESVRVFFSGDKDALRAWKNPNCFAESAPFGKPLIAKNHLVFEGNAKLKPGQNYFWIAVKLASKANIDHQIHSWCSQVKSSDGKTHKLKQQTRSPARIGVAVLKQSDYGSHTYRIPGLVTTNAGTLIGVYDVRRRGGGDLPGDIDVGMSRSVNGGQSWEPMRVIMDMGEDPKWRYDGIGDPALLVDKNTGTIWVIATWSHGNRSWRGSGPGLEPEETGQLMLVRSDDDGLTWSKPINITSQVKNPEWCFLLQGPGKGITMRDGTLVFAAQYQDTPTNKRLPRSSIIYSKDHGVTWHMGTGAFDDTTEAQVVETETGVLMLNCRYNRAATRVVATTRDMGKTWQTHATSQRSLIEPRSCMASLINVDQEVGHDRGGWLLFSNPDSATRRDRITIKASHDDGATWPKRYRLLLDQGLGAGYSCMTMLDANTVGILYEGSLAHMTFQRIPLEDITGPQLPGDNNAKPNPSDQTLHLPIVFGDHMVLQANADIPVWGTAAPGQQISVQLGSEQVTTTSDRSGQWSVRFPPRIPTKEPTSIYVRNGQTEITVSDVLIGEVWVCAGQSNMEWPLSKSEHAKSELNHADRPQIRLLNLVGAARGSSGSYSERHLSRLTPDKFYNGRWTRANAKSAASFSAVGWYFGRHIHAKLDVPVGLINLAIGGTPTEAWIRPQAIQASSEFKTMFDGNWLDNARLGSFCRARGTQNLLAAIQAGETVPGDNFGPNHSFKPGFLWRAAISRIIPFGIQGVIWYQGESNAESSARAEEHKRLLPLLIQDWRTEWGQGDFPFLFVQLPAINRLNWPQFRNGQRQMVRELNNVGMAITIDTGEIKNVHPRLKKPVGERLAHWALGTTYKTTSDAPYSGPLVASCHRNGNHIKIRFDHVGMGLKSSDGEKLRHFEVGDSSGQFVATPATIIDQDTILLKNESVQHPTHVRYAWVPFPSPPVNLCGSTHLPASPFRTAIEKNSGEHESNEAVNSNAPSQCINLQSNARRTRLVQ